jgi:hypothetical protein
MIDPLTGGLARNFRAHGNFPFFFGFLPSGKRKYA